ncbi:winged helix-turn-helix domain-containing protein [Halococcus salsus]|uniref:winged helix-turn-helix domain-containing protein n=1 Tax=Halococcus salsus TaxID=2162894 RepID=UPI001359391B|nr:winged helix-turn-helix domain-containing protein [Halococcus salsus]
MSEDDTPGRKPRVTEREILEVFRKADEPVLTAPEVATVLPIGRRALHNRLKQLEKKGQLVSKQAGRSTVWWSPAYTFVVYDDLDED